MLRTSHSPVAPPPEIYLTSPPPEVFQFPPLSESLFRSFWLSRRDEMSLAWAEASSKEIWTMVSVSVATVARSAAVAVARLAKASTVSNWWSAVGLKVSTALARGKFYPAVRRKFAFHSRCAFAKCTLKVFQSRLRGGFRFHSFKSS